ncbi:expressed protein [Phakopsora pachyrhizi]|uniref:Expressed protein n=1 Tax=Phakopsora pachyrhizi TaxID=170000 RepID=A0AAV0AV02_PHAPC|nr:expressed protein [Phakopsora pachyrhizi]
MMNYQSTSHTDHIHHQQPPPSYSTLIDQPTQHPSHPHQSQQSQPSSGLEAITTADERTRLLFDSSANSPVVAHQPSSSPPVSPLLIISSLLGSYLCCFITFILGISVTYPNTFIINHPGSFSLPITFSFLSALVFDLNLFIISPSSVRSRTYLISILSNFTSISFLTSLQLLSLILNPTLRSADLDLSLITGSILIVSTLIGSSSIVSIIKSSNLNTSSSPSSNRVSININLISLNLSQSSHNQRQRLSVWIPSFRSHNNSKFQRFRSWLSPYYARLLSALSFLLLCQVFWINIDSLKFSGQLYSVNIPTLTSKDNRFSHDHQLQTLKGSITTKVQLSCQWLNQPAEYFPSTTQSSLTQESLNHNTTLATHTSELSPIITQTIISFSPSRFTSYESTRWIQSLKTHPNSILSSSRLCQFDRPGYNFSDNLTINQISSSVIILEKALKTSGEFDRLHHNWNGVGSSGFVLVGHDYGALEAKLFASRNSRWINSIVYIDPQSGKRFFSDQLNLASFTTVVAWSFTNSLLLFFLSRAGFSHTLKLT